MKATKRAKDSKNKRAIAEMKSCRDSMLASGAEQLICELCGFQSISSLLSHITRKHGIKMDEYRSRYPLSVVQRSSAETKLRVSASLKERLKDPVEREAFMRWRSFPSEVKHWIRKGLDPREAQEKVSEFQHRQSIKGNNEKTRAIRSLRNSGSGNPMSLASIASREGISEQEARSLTPCFGRTGELHPMFGKKHTEEAIKKIGQYMSHSQVSKVEHDMSTEIEQFIAGKRNCYVNGWCCDFVVDDKKLICEFFGDFWHANPSKYGIDWINPISKKHAKDIRDRDERKLSELRELGYHVIVIWESDWRFDKDVCMQRIKDVYNRIL